MTTSTSTSPALLALMGEPASRDHLAADLLDQLDGVGFDAVVATSTAAIAPASFVAGRRALPMAYLRPKAKAHGKGKQIEGEVPAGASALVFLGSASNVDEPRLADTLLGGNVAAYVLPGQPSTELAGALAANSARLVQLRHAPGEPERDAPADSAQSRALEGSVAEAVALALLDIGAVSINHQTPFTYVSGLRSPIYTDNRLLISHPGAWRTVADAFARTLEAEVGLRAFDVLGGTATSGIPHAMRLADDLRLPLVYVDFADAEAGEIVGPDPRGTRVLMIEDLITTGGSVLQSAGSLRDSGATVDWCLAIFTYDPSQAAERLGAHGLQVRTLTSLPVLLDVGVRTQRLSAEAADQVREWVRDPQGWSSAHA